VTTSRYGATRRPSQGAKSEAEANLSAVELAYESNIGGVNTSVANIEAQLRQAQFYLDNTTVHAPEDGRIVNLQVRPGMVSGILRVGGIAALIADEGRYRSRPTIRRT
jgi:multidrug resistance efflux pump